MVTLLAKGTGGEEGAGISFDGVAGGGPEGEGSREEAADAEGLRANGRSGGPWEREGESRNGERASKRDGCEVAVAEAGRGRVVEFELNEGRVIGGDLSAPGGELKSRNEKKT